MQTKTKSFKNAIFCAIITLVLCLTAFAFAGCNPPKDPPAEPPTTTTSLTKAQCNTALVATKTSLESDTAQASASGGVSVNLYDIPSTDLVPYDDMRGDYTGVGRYLGTTMSKFAISALIEANQDTEYQLGDVITSLMTPYHNEYAAKMTISGEGNILNGQVTLQGAGHFYYTNFQIDYDFENSVLLGYKFDVMLGAPETNASALFCLRKEGTEGLKSIDTTSTTFENIETATLSSRNQFVNATVDKSGYDFWDVFVTLYGDPIADMTKANYIEAISAARDSISSSFTAVSALSIRDYFTDAVEDYVPPANFEDVNSGDAGAVGRSAILFVLDSFNKILQDSESNMYDIIDGTITSGTDSYNVKLVLLPLDYGDFICKFIMTSTTGTEDIPLIYAEFNISYDFDESSLGYCDYGVYYNLGTGGADDYMWYLESEDGANIEVLKTESEYYDDYKNALIADAEEFMTIDAEDEGYDFTEEFEAIF